MALGTNGFTGGNGGDLTVDIPLLWGNQINDYFRYGLELAAFFVDRSDELSDGGAAIYTPNLSALSTNAKTTNSQVTLTSPEYTKVTLDVSTWKEASFVIEDREAAQIKKSYYLQEKIAKGAAWEVAQDLEDAIAALFTGITTNVVGLGTANMADSSLLAAIAILETAGVPVYTGETAFIFHPNTFYRQVGNIDKMSLFTNTGSEMPRMKKQTRMLYGIPVIVSPAVPVGTGAVGDNGARLNLLANRDTFHWARLSMPVKAKSGMIGSEGVRVQQSYVHEYLGDLVTVDLCYGVVENRDDAAVKIRSHSVAVGL
jgi:hypothetical protein